MANVNIKFNGKEYLLSCDDGQEESLKKLVIFLDKKYLELKEKLGNIGENKLLLITSIKLIDEHFDLKRRIGDQKIKLDNLSNKFKELKTLAIEYKDNKEPNIRADYLVTDKADGERTLLYISDKGKCYLIDRQKNISYMGLVMNDFKNSVYDGEFINKTLDGKLIQNPYVFDSYIVNGKDITNNHFGLDTESIIQKIKKKL